MAFRRLHGTKMLLALVASSVLVASGPGAPRIGPGGAPATECQWPSVVGVHNSDGQLCTGTLIHPRVVLYAAHCGTSPQIYLGESSGAPRHTIQPARCARHPSFGGQVGAMDYAYCLLQEPLDDIPVTPLAVGCEAQIEPGVEVVIVGYGFDASGALGTKRWAATAIQSGVQGTVFHAGDSGTVICGGDSGGPVMLAGSDGGWRSLGVASGVPGGSSSCGAAHGIYGPGELAIEWIEADAGIDVTPCHDGAGAWNPGPNCGGFAASPADPTTGWDEMCAGARTGRSDTCGPPSEDGGGEGGDDGDGEPGDPSEEPSGSDTGATHETGATGSGSDWPGGGGAIDPIEREAGCGCAGSGPRRSAPWLAILLGAAGSRRRTRVEPGTGG